MTDIITTKTSHKHVRELDYVTNI